MLVEFKIVECHYVLLVELCKVAKKWRKWENVRSKPGGPGRKII